MVIKVFFDGVCGQCSKEISHYKNIAPPSTFLWLDVASDPDAMKEYNVTQAEALLYLHVVDEFDQIHLGSSAFALIWKKLPGWRSLGLFISLPIIKSATNQIYIFFANRRFKSKTHCQLASTNLSQNKTLEE